MDRRADRHLRFRAARRAFLLAALVVGPTGCRERGAARAPLAARARHLVLVTFDTTRADRIGCYGRAGAETPTLDGLAAGGVRFAHAYTTAPVTLPAHVSMLTGLYPFAHGVRDNGTFRLADDAVTLAEVLRDQGFHTAAFVSATVLARTYGLAQGFDLYEDRIPCTLVPLAGVDERPANLTTDAAIAWLAGQDLGRERVFLWVHYFDPHLAYVPPEPFRTRHARDPYAGEIAFADAELGRLLGSLRSAGVLDDTLVVATADHGESLGEHGEAAHGVFIYDATMRVPLILAHPALPAGRVVAEPVSVVDVVPTALAVLGVPPPTTQGRNLFEGLDEPVDERPLYMESEYTHLTLGWAPLQGVRSGRYKLVSAPRPEIYDLDSDPGELRNRLTELPAERTALESALHRLQAEGPVLETQALVPDAASRRRLEALGYVGVGGAPSGAAPEGRDPKDMISTLATRAEGFGLLYQGQVDEAERILRAAIAESPDDVHTLSMLGIIALNRQRWEEGESWFRKVLARGGASPPILYYLAHAAGGLGRAEEAERLLGEAVSLDPSFCAGFRMLAGLHRMRGEEAVTRGDRSGAASELDRALGYQRRLIDVWWGDPATLAEFRREETDLAARRQALGG